MTITERLNSVLPTIPAGVTLVVAVKYANDKQIKELLLNKINDLGFNTSKQLLEVKEKIPANFHFIGHLQRNKVKEILPFCTLIHSVDSIKLAEKISEEAIKINKQQEILLQIRTDEQKDYGFKIDEIETILPQIAKLKNIIVKGLMTIPAPDEEPRSIYHKMKLLKEELDLPELSMGMSNDYKIAVEEGATLVRIGRMLFE
ncbi:MAG: YggS family pyridoxal phosphate-dependent enzyme [Nanoarchaeota archaeon]